MLCIGIEAAGAMRGAAVANGGEDSVHAAPRRVKLAVLDSAAHWRVAHPKHRHPAIRGHGCLNYVCIHHKHVPTVAPSVASTATVTAQRARVKSVIMMVGWSEAGKDTRSFSSPHSYPHVVKRSYQTRNSDGLHPWDLGGCEGGVLDRR